MTGELNGDRAPRCAKLLLFIKTGSPNGRVAWMNLCKVIDRSGEPKIAYELVDVDEEPERVLAWRIFATPTLLWSDQPFGRRLIGDLSSESYLSAFLA